MVAPILPCAAAVVGVAPREPEAARHRARGHAPRSAGRAGRRHRGGAAAAGRALPRCGGGDQPAHRRARGGDPRGARGARGRVALARPLDLLVPSFVLERDAAARLLARSRARNATVYGEWAALVLGLAPEVAYLECRGLDWETPDRHRRAVRRLGLPAWRRRQETPAEWARRIAMAADFLAGFEHALGRPPITRPAVRSLAPRA